MVDELALKKAFENIKQDLYYFTSQIHYLRTELNELKNSFNTLNLELNNLKINQKMQNKSKLPTSTYNSHSSTDGVTSTHNSTVPPEIEGFKSPNMSISMRNEGVSTDRQTIRQTDKYPENKLKNSLKRENNTFLTDSTIDQSINHASEMLENLDNLKKQIRIKLKSMTQQEMLVFSTIYQLEEQGVKDISYNGLAQRLHLSQSSIRDYVQRIINKGISIQKTKLNNKKILLQISPELHKIASLQTILQLREL